MANIIFWDYDGTLINTEIIYKDSIEDYLKKQGQLLKEIPNEYFFKHLSGRHPEEILPKLEEDNYIKKGSPVTAQDVRQYYNIYFSELEKGTIEITKNIDSLIEKLAAKKDLIMCITSSSFRSSFILKRNNVDNKILNKTFDIEKNVYLCGSIENCEFKPSPDIFLYALKDISKKYSLNLTKDNHIIVVEDSAAGCQAGHSFKNKKGNEIDITIIGYLGGTLVDNTDQLLKSGADIVIKNNSDLYNTIESIL